MLNIGGESISSGVFVGGDSAGSSTNYFGEQQGYYGGDIGEGSVQYGGYEGGYEGGYGYEGGGGYSAESPYVGQDYGFGQELSQMVSNDFANFGQERQDQGGIAAMGQRQQPAQQQQPTNAQQQVGRQEQPRAGVTTGGMQAPTRQPAQQQQPMQQAETKLPEIPSGMSAQSARERTSTIDDAIESGNQLAISGEESAMMRESSGSIGTPLTMSTEPVPTGSSERSYMPTMRNAADRAASRNKSVAADESSDRFNNERKPFWANPIDRVVRFSQSFNVRQKASIEANKKKAANRFKRMGVGYHVYGKVNGLISLDFDEVGVGVQEIVAVIQQNSEMLDRLIQRYVPEFPGSENVGISGVIDVVNNNDIWVATFKPPDNQGPDMQRRRLRILTQQQRGIYLHNIMAAMYTADYDGDDMSISLDPDVSNLVKNTMDYMVDNFGKITLNIDFMPVSKIIPIDGEMTTEQYVRTTMLAGIDDSRASLSPVIRRIIELGDTENDPDKQEEAWGNLFMEVRKFTDKVTGNKTISDKLMSDICKSVFEGMRLTKYYNSLTTAGIDVDEDAIPEPVTYDDIVAHKIMDGIVDGVLPNNFQELKLMLTGFTGNVKGKNAPFRFSADVGKMMKMDKRLMVGNEFVVDPNNDEQMKSFFESTVKYTASIKMAREIKKMGRSKYYTQELRIRVLNEVGFPERYGSFREFINTFVESYNKNAAIINEANITFLTNMQISSNSNRSVVAMLKSNSDMVTFGEIAEPILSVYGTYSVERFFNVLSASGFMRREKRDDFWAGNPNARKRERTVEQEHGNRENRASFWITGKYADYNLRQFRDENRLIRGDSNMDDKKDRHGNVQRVGIRNTTIGTQMDDVDMQFNLMLAIADKRTSVSSAYNTCTFGTMEGKHKDDETTTVNMMSKLLNTINDNLANNDGFDQPLQIDDAMRALIMSDPDLFTYYNMDSSESFLKSEWGKKMLEHANDLEVLGGIYTSMMFDYRMERITALSEELLTLSDTSRLEETWNDLLFAKDELASSSGVWSGIIREFEADASDGTKSFFQMMMDKNPVQYAIDGRPYAWDIEKDARDFWNDPGKHHSLRSVIDDLDLDRTTKWNVIADVVRYWQKDAYLKSYEVGYQLGVGPNAAYAQSSMKGVMTVHREFENAFNRWGKTSHEMLKKDVEGAYKKFSKKPGALIRTLEKLDKEPWELVEIDDMMYADSIMSVYDKTYAQTEKASQNPWTNSIYQALSIQNNGGFMNDVQRTDDRLLGMTSVDSITIHDVIHILANPQDEMTVYNHEGQWCLLTRDILLKNELGDLSGDIEADIWRFLLRQPRIASAIRKHSACVVSNTDGKGYLGASRSMSETIEKVESSAPNIINQVKYMMRDYPDYGSILALALPGRGLVTRTARRRIKQIEDYFAYELYAAAISDWDSVKIAEVVLGDIGITDKRLRSVMESDYDTYLKELELDAYKYASEKDKRSESEKDADEIYSRCLKWVTGYIEDIRNNKDVRLGQYVPRPAEPDNIGPDAVSAAAFWDVMQELNGAKTSVSTGVEGFETYQLAEWVSHIDAKDKYADLQSITEDPRFGGESWDMAWTNVIAPDGGTMSLHVEGNVVANLEEIEEAARQQGINEIIVRVPDGYIVRDRSTDTRGTQVASLMAYMISKRSNGAEAFNLKAKKAGMDDTRSIIKMHGKHKTINMRDKNGNTITRNVSYAQTQFILQSTYRMNGGGEIGRHMAIQELAKMMLEENKDLGYEDLTLANYMSIADLMLRIGDDGELHLRSLEMLISAIKHRIGWRIDDMNDEQLTEATMRIVNDTSENGVGMSMMESLEAFDNLRPCSRSMQHDAIRQSSSVFKRNYDLLEEIAQKESSREDGLGVNPLTADQAEEINGKLSKIVLGDKKSLSRMLGGYNIVGIVGYGANVDERHWNIGPSNVIAIGSQTMDEDTLRGICRRAYSLGMTIVCNERNIDNLPDFVKESAVPISDDSNDVLIPCFDMRLNGAEASPYKARFAIAQAPFSRYVVSVEDSLNEFGLGDAQAKPLQTLIDRMSVRDGNSVKITAESMFPNVFKNPRFVDCHFTVGLANGDEIRSHILDGLNCTIDYGLAEGSSGFEQRVRDVDKAIERYRQKWNAAGPDGLMMGGLAECEPGDIVGWAEVGITHPDGSTEYVLAPIIPFPLDGTRTQPARYSVENMGPIDNDNTVFGVDWENRTDITEGYLKYFDSSGGANKGMMDMTDVLQETRTLLDGTAVDAYIAKASTDSRKVGTDRRIKTMISLMALARMHGYNFARKPDGTMNEGAFPDNPEIREKLFAGRISIDEWKQILGSETKFVLDRRLDAFIRYECNKIMQDGGNPSDYLANVYTDENGEEYNTHVMWEFEAMFDQGLNYEDGLLRFLNFVNPKNSPDDPDFCPNGIDDDTENTLFRLYKQDGEIAQGYDRGVLQMRVPHRKSDNGISYVWDNVYIGMSFFGEEYSGFTRPNVSGASNFLDGMNTMSMYGKRLDSRSARYRADWATSDIARLPHGNGSMERVVK